MTHQGRRLGGISGLLLANIMVGLLLTGAAGAAAERDAGGGHNGPYTLALTGALSPQMAAALATRARAAGWTTILSEGFEGSWPTAEWRVFDNDATMNGEYFWAKRNCRAHTGSFSAWGVGGGADGSGQACGTNYPHLADAWMIYGPFDLTDATAAELSFAFWLKGECVGDGCTTKRDRLCAVASNDGETFATGRCYAGDYTLDPRADANGWVIDQLNLTPFRGQAQVWIAFVFQSDDTVTHPGGAFVDDILLRSAPYLAYFPIMVAP